MKRPQRDKDDELEELEEFEARLGSRDDWPSNLRTIADLVLGSREPLFAVWGPERILVDNEASRAIFAPRLSGPSGRPVSEAWPEARELLEPIIERGFDNGEADRAENRPLVLEPAEDGDDEPKELRVTLSWDPIRDDRGEIAGLFCTCRATTVEITQIHEEYGEFLRELRHDLRAPLNAIALGAELLRRRLEQGSPDPEGFTGPVTRIAENVRRMADMLEEWKEMRHG